MSLTTLRILSVVFVALFFVVGISWVMPRNRERVAAPELTLSGITYDTATKVTWKQGSNSMNLTKENGVWRINGFETNDARVKDLFAALKNLDIRSLASRNAATASDFEVTESTGKIVSFTNGGEAQDIIIGKQGATPDTFYLKQKGSDRVYLVKSSLKSTLENALLWWRDTAITKIDAASLQSIEIKQGATTSQLTKNKEGIWELTRNGKKTELEAKKAETLVLVLSSLQASDIATPQEEALFQNTKNRVTLVAHDAANVLLAQLTFVQHKDLWLVQALNKQTIFKVPSATVEKIVKL